MHRIETWPVIRKRKAICQSSAFDSAWDQVYPSTEHLKAKFHLQK